MINLYMTKYRVVSSRSYDIRLKSWTKSSDDILIEVALDYNNLIDDNYVITTQGEYYAR